jgi:hypothetical protein
MSSRKHNETSISVAKNKIEQRVEKKCVVQARSRRCGECTPQRTNILRGGCDVAQSNIAGRKRSKWGTKKVRDVRRNTCNSCPNHRRQTGAISKYGTEEDGSVRAQKARVIFVSNHSRGTEEHDRCASANSHVREQSRS